MSPSDEQIRAAIAAQASEWFIENRSGALDRNESARFLAWLQASPIHLEEYLRIASLAPGLEAAAKANKTPREALIARAGADRVIGFDPSVSGSALRRPCVAQPWSLAAAAALACVALASLWLLRDGERFGLPRTYRTAHGEQSVRVLPDGSTLHLNSDSQVTVNYTRRERVVVLDRGQALFQVAREGERAFRVAAGNAQVLDVGTQFDVYRSPGAVTVTVVEGTVAVYTGSPQVTPIALRVGAGYQLQIRGEVGLPRPVNARAAVAWIKHKIVFEKVPLGEVADEFNRYGRVPIEIDDAALRTLPITGAFDAYDTDSFVAFLSMLNDVAVQKTPSRIRVMTRTSSPRVPPPEVP